jgi:arabinofuranan 3-O-arabinosyltransferase
MNVTQRNRVLAWLGKGIGRKEFIVWGTVGICIYLVWGLVIRPYAIDFNIYRFAGYAYLEGLSPYDQSQAAFDLAAKYGLVPFAPRYVYFPVFSQVMAVLVPLPYPLLRGLFILISSICLFGACWFFVRDQKYRLQRYQMLALLGYLPILNCIAAGQVSMLLLGAVVLMAHGLSNTVSKDTQWLDWSAGAAFGLSLVLKPVLYPLGIWLLVKRQYKMVFAAAIAFVAVVGVSVITGGIQPWIDYVGILGSFSKSDPYIENQAFAGFAARVFGVGLAQMSQYVVLIIVLGAWFVLFRRLETFFEIAALAVISVFLSPVAWYYYFVLLIPIFLVFSARYQSMPLWFIPLWVSAYVLIQLHGLVWQRIPDTLSFVNLGFYGLVVMLVLVFVWAFRTNKSEMSVQIGELA